MNKTYLRFIPTILLTTLILLLSWYGRIVQKLIRDLLGLEGLLILVCITCLIFVILVGQVFQLRNGIARLLLILYPIGIYVLRANPEEAVHLTEYGSFALSISWIFAGRVSLTKNFLYSIIGASTMGLIDEGLQGINPSRVFDLRDILINVVAAAVTVALFPPKSKSKIEIE